MEPCQHARLRACLAGSAGSSAQLTSPAPLSSAWLPPPLPAPRQLPPGYQSQLERDGVHRVVCDYIAGMTDRFAVDEYQKLFDPTVRV